MTRYLDFYRLQHFQMFLDSYSQQNDQINEIILQNIYIKYVKNLRFKENIFFENI